MACVPGRENPGFVRECHDLKWPVMMARLKVTIQGHYVMPGL